MINTDARKNFSIAFVVFAFFSVIIFPYVRFYADNPDTFQYISISSKYASGDWSHAINGYWSPLISWLLILPSLFFDDILAFKFLQFFIGTCALFQWCNYLDKTSISKNLKLILSIVSVPFLVDHALLDLTPDLLFVAFLLYIINLSLNENIFSERRQAIKTGIAGALLYLTKAFGFPFFIVFILVIFFVAKRLKPNLLLTFGTFLIVCLLWIIPLSVHYNQLTISKVPGFNMSRDMAPLPDRTYDLPILGKGLHAPQLNSISAWENPGDYVNHETISLFNSPSEYLKVVKRNILSIYYFDFSRQLGIIFLILLFIFIARIGIKEFVNRKWIFTSVIFIFLIYGGYSAILFHARYSWINYLLMMALSFAFIAEIFKSSSWKYVSGILIVVVLLVAVKRPLKEIVFTNDSNIPIGWFVKAVKHPFQTMWVYYRPDHRLQREISDIHEKKVISRNIASLKHERGERDLYTNALRISKAENCIYFGQVDDQLPLQEQVDELKKMDVNFLITWKNTSWKGGELVYFNFETMTRIYSLK